MEIEVDRHDDEMREIDEMPVKNTLMAEVEQVLNERIEQL